MFKTLKRTVKSTLMAFSVASLALSAVAGANTTNVQAASCDDLLAGSYSIGQQGASIVQLQDCLTVAGDFSYSGGSTGYYGPITQSALNSYKTRVVGSTTPAPTPAAGTTSCDALTSSSYSIGQQNSSVTDLQNCLIQSGHFTFSGGATGYYGSITQTALSAYLNSQNTYITPEQASANESTDCDVLTSNNYNIGEQGNAVVRLQDCLTATGHFTFSSGSTGYYGSITQTALNAYRASQGSTTTTTTTPAPSTTTACDNLLTSSWSIGQQSSQVVALQDCLTATGHFTFSGGSTGYYGSITEVALNAYKQSNGIVSSSLQSDINAEAAIWAQRGITPPSAPGSEYKQIMVDTSQQFMYLYEGGQLINSSPVVTGKDGFETEEVAGKHSILYKAKDAVLNSPFEGISYSVPVNYWMPFYSDYGIHDANWRTSFGGQDYTYNGSHGCVNSPIEIVEYIWDWAPVGTPVYVQE